MDAAYEGLARTQLAKVRGNERADLRLGQRPELHDEGPLRQCGRKAIRERAGRARAGARAEQQHDGGLADPVRDAQQGVCARRIHPLDVVDEEVERPPRGEAEEDLRCALGERVGAARARRDALAGDSIARGAREARRDDLGDERELAEARHELVITRSGSASPPRRCNIALEDAAQGGERRVVPRALELQDGAALARAPSDRREEPRLAGTAFSADDDHGAALADRSLGVFPFRLSLRHGAEEVPDLLELGSARHEGDRPAIELVAARAEERLAPGHPLELRLHRARLRVAVLGIVLEQASDDLGEIDGHCRRDQLRARVRAERTDPRARRERLARETLEENPRDREDVRTAVHPARHH